VRGQRGNWALLLTKLSLFFYFYKNDRYNFIQKYNLMPLAGLAWMINILGWNPVIVYLFF
jgi:membrane-associated HD superfamily phosphohydrolase